MKCAPAQWEANPLSSAEKSRPGQDETVLGRSLTSRRVYVCVDAYIHTYIPAYMYAYYYMSVYYVLIYMHMHTHMYMNTYIHMCRCACK